MITDKRQLAVLAIAQILDHPSVFMGGPSQHNKRNGDRILRYLEKEGIAKFENAAPAVPIIE